MSRFLMELPLIIIEAFLKVQIPGSPFKQESLRWNLNLKNFSKPSAGDCDGPRGIGSYHGGCMVFYICPNPGDASSEP